MVLGFSRENWAMILEVTSSYMGNESTGDG